MSFPKARFLPTLAVALGVWTGLAATTEAGLIPWVYDAVFGPVGSQRAYYGGYAPMTYGAAFRGYGPLGYSDPCCSPCGPAGCSPCATGACGIQSFYGPSYGQCCDPCSACGIGGCGIGGCGPGGCGIPGCGPAGCPSGQCGLPGDAFTDGGLTPAPEGPPPVSQPPRTYRDEVPPYRDEAPSSRPAPGLDDEGFRPRSNEGFPMDTGVRRPGPATDEFEPPASSIPPRSREPAPMRPTIGDDEDNAGIRGPSLNLDGKVTWRPASTRQRLSLRPNYESVSVTRKTAPQGKWVTRPSDSKVASK